MQDVSSNSLTNYTKIDKINLSEKKLKIEFFEFLFKLFQYNSQDIHKDDKLKYLYFITDDDVLYNNELNLFIYNLNLDQPEDYTIRSLMENKYKYIFIHPLLYLNLKNSGRGLNFNLKSIKYLSWSIGIFILLHVYNLPCDHIKELYSESLSENIIVDFRIRSVLPYENISNKEIDFIEKLLYCSDSQDEEEIYIFFQNFIKNQNN